VKAFSIVVGVVLIAVMGLLMTQYVRTVYEPLPEEDAQPAYTQSVGDGAYADGHVAQGDAAQTLDAGEFKGADDNRIGAAHFDLMGTVHLPRPSDTALAGAMLGIMVLLAYHFRRA